MSLSLCRIYVYEPEVLGRIRTNIVYFPASRAHPLPLRRREAYGSGGLLPCPMDDPEGWLAWPTLTVHGMVNSDTKSRHAKAECAVCIIFFQSFKLLI